jgi:hypothetical protein
VAAASQIVFSREQTALKSGVGIPDINQKVEHRTGHQVNLQSGATSKKDFYIDCKKILKIVAFKRSIRIF